MGSALKPDEANKLAISGQVDAFIEICRTHLQAEPDPIIFGQYVNAKKVTEADGELVTTYQKIADGGLQSKELFYALGKCYDDLINRSQSQLCYDKANVIAAKEAPFQRTAITYLTEANMQFFADKKIDKSLGNKSDRPIFIIGMPRSGTSLAEQILCTDPDVYGCGELLSLQQIVMHLSFQNQQKQVIRYPHTLNFMDKAYYNYAGETYLNDVARFNSSAKRTIDKMPANYLYAGFINMILPNARIIHTIRDPRDIALSLYFTNFENIGMAYSNSWDEIIFVLEEYFKLMAFWKNLLPDMFELKYENLIGNFDKTAVSLLGACNLKTDSYQNFYKIERDVTTASRFQVRRPIYKSSSGKWKNYELYYAAEFNRITEIATKHGYEWN